MNESPLSRPSGCLARAVMALALSTALITLAAVALFLIAILPISESLRPWVGLALFVGVGAVVIVVMLRRARSGDAAVQQHLGRLFGPLGLSLQERGDLAGTYTGVYRGHDLRAAYAISGAPQRPTYHLEIALNGDTRLRMAIGMAKFRFQFDETHFGALLSSQDAELEPLAIYTENPDAARALLASPRAKNAIIDLLSPDAPGVRNLVIENNAFILRYRHLSLKGLNADLIERWVDDLAAVAEAEKSATAT